MSREMKLWCLSVQERGAVFANSCNVVVASVL